MKKIVLLFATVLITVIGANIFAQNTGLLPSGGSTHQYWVNSSTGIAHDGDGGSHVGNSYTWWISINSADLTAVESPGSLFTVANGPAYNMATVDSFNIGITWNPSSVEDTIYLVVQETDANGNLCSNLKALGIVPQNNFEVQFVALSTDGITVGDSLSRCAPDIALTASGLNITYDYGMDTVMFKLAATGIYSSWSFTGTFDLTTLGNTTSNIEYKIGSSSWSSSAPAPVPANAAGQEDVYIRVALDNGDTGGTYQEGTSEQTIKLSLSDVQDSGTNSAVITNALNSDITSEPVQLHSILARPNTSGIGTDN
jgi:hypothetical protein